MTDVPRLNQAVPDFSCTTTHGPMDSFLKWKEGKWCLLFSHPADFTPVCTTEFIEFAKRWEWFSDHNVSLLGCSVDSIYSHIAWCRAIEEKFGVKIPFPVIADLDQKVVRLYNMVPDISVNTSAARCVFFIDPKNVLRATIYYPLNVGRNFDEIIRVITALQTVDKYPGHACPANWTAGQQVIVGAPVTTEGAEKRLAQTDVQVTDWWFAKKTLA